MYAYEKDLLYNFSIPRYSGKTIRISTYTSYKREHWLFEFKIFYQWQAVLNSWDIGLKAQMKYSFQKP
jgi:LAS superfamily LD-carboxypeptidase LdcB